MVTASAALAVLGIERIHIFLSNVIHGLGWGMYVVASIVPLAVTVGTFRWACNRYRDSPDKEDATVFAYAAMIALTAWLASAIAFSIHWS
jgi:hypothetical protein